MEKEFEALKTIKIKCHPNSNPSPLVDEALEIVEQALTELKQIKEAKPSEALESLKSLDIQTRFMGILDIPSWEKHLPIIKQSLLKAQEQEKVLEIIKKAFKSSSLYMYKLKDSFDCGWITQEEFDLLKRWCEKCQKKS